MNQVKRVFANEQRFKQLCYDIQDLWQELGSDAYALAAENGERLTNAMALELCLDADRIEFVAKTGKASNAYIAEVCATKGGYAALVRALQRKCKLV